MAEIDPSARIQLRNMGELQHPASCAVCGSGSCDAGYVDIGVYFEYEGYVYLCISCLTQAAEAGGMLSIEQSQYLRDQNNELVAESKLLHDKMEKALERLGHYDALLNDSISNSNLVNASSDHSNDEVLTEATGESTDSASEPTDDDVSSGEGHVSEPTKPVKGAQSSRTVRDAGSDLDL